MKYKEFTPTYMKNDEYWSDNTHNNHFNDSYNMDMNSFFEMSMYQYINERFTNMFNTKYNAFDQIDLHHTLTKSKSMPTDDIASEITQELNMTLDQSEASDTNTNHITDEVAFYEKLDHEISCFVINVEKQLASVSEERDILSKRIIYKICKKAFPDQPIRLDVFGSLASGLALETSDMDLVITGLKIENREDVIDHIRTLTQHFEECAYFSNIKAIEGASIPIIKLEADLQKVREVENTQNCHLISNNMRFLQIDITFDDSKERKTDSFWEGLEWNRSKLHYGLKSVHLVKSYIKEYVHLKELTLCIK